MSPFSNIFLYEERIGKIYMKFFKDFLQKIAQFIIHYDNIHVASNFSFDTLIIS
jgi:hypothetical protein